MTLQCWLCFIISSNKTPTVILYSKSQHDYVKFLLLNFPFTSSDDIFSPIIVYLALEMSKIRMHMARFIFLNQHHYNSNLILKSNLISWKLTLKIEWYYET